MDKIQKKMAELGTGKFFKPKEGKNQVRILPPWNDEGLFFLEATAHYGLKKEGRDIPIPCSGKADCPICQFIRKMEKGGKEDTKLAKRLASRTKFYVNILDRKSEKVSIWGFSRKILGGLLNRMDDEDFGDITDPDEGFDVIIEREGTGMKTSYDVRVKPKSSSVDLDELELLDLEKEVSRDLSEDEIEDLIEENFGEEGKRRPKGDDDGDGNGSEDEDIEVGTKVSFEDEEGEELTGKVISIDEEEDEAKVKDSDGEKHTVDLEDLTPVDEEKGSTSKKEKKETSKERRIRRRKERRAKRKKKR